MKLIYSTMAIAAGFVGSMCIFAVGAGTAAYFIAIEPHDGPGPAVATFRDFGRIVSNANEKIRSRLSRSGSSHFPRSPPPNVDRFIQFPE